MIFFFSALPPSAVQPSLVSLHQFICILRSCIHVWWRDFRIVSSIHTSVDHHLFTLTVYLSFVTFRSCWTLCQNFLCDCIGSSIRPSSLSIPSAGRNCRHLRPRSRNSVQGCKPLRNTSNRSIGSSSQHSGKRKPNSGLGKKNFGQRSRKRCSSPQRRRKL